MYHYIYTSIIYHIYICTIIYDIYTHHWRLPLDLLEQVQLVPHETRVRELHLVGVHVQAASVHAGDLPKPICITIVIIIIKNTRKTSSLDNPYKKL